VVVVVAAPALDVRAPVRRRRVRLPRPLLLPRMLPPQSLLLPPLRFNL
jgi:hypothetical protein